MLCFQQRGMVVKKYGRQRQHPHNTPDNHPRKNEVNWWEDEFHDGNKKRARQKAKKDIKKEIEESDETI